MSIWPYEPAERWTSVSDATTTGAPSAGRSRRESGWRCAFSLIELVVSLSIVSVLMVSIASAMVLASRAIPAPDDASVTSPQTTRLLSRMTEELHYAAHIVERTDRAITFTVPDRDGDGSPQRIRYAWSGTAGDPLTRQYDDGPAVEVADDVHDFELDYDITSLTETYPGPAIEDATLRTIASQVSYNRTATISSSRWYGQYIDPSSYSLDADAVAWRPTEVEVHVIGEDGLFGVVLVNVDTYLQLRTADADTMLPGSDVLSQARLKRDQLLGLIGAWFAEPLPAAPIVDAKTPLTLVAIQLPWQSGARLHYRQSSGQAGLVSTLNSGSTWSSHSGNALAYRIRGHQLIQYPDQQLTRQHLTHVHISIQRGSDTARPHQTTTALVNAPELLDAVWQTDFAASPTAVDFDRNDVIDWTTPSGSLGTIATRPMNDLRQPVTVHLRFRNVGSGESSFHINADWRGDGRCAPITAVLSLDDDGQQQIVVSCGDDELLRRTGLTDDFQDLRLLIDPTPRAIPYGNVRGTIHIRLNNEPQGTTWQYRRTSVVHNYRSAAAMSGPASQWDFISIRVGGQP